jgi:membrane protein involved in colicin uptake
MAARKPKKEKKVKQAKTAKEKTGAEEATEAEKAEKAAERFVEDLLIRGEAAWPDPQGDLPPGATHEIVAEPGSGRSPKPPKVRRRRFSMD